PVTPSVTSVLPTYQPPAASVIIPAAGSVDNGSNKIEVAARLLPSDLPAGAGMPSGYVLGLGSGPVGGVAPSRPNQVDSSAGMPHLRQPLSPGQEFIPAVLVTPADQDGKADNAD